MGHMNDDTTSQVESNHTIYIAKYKEAAERDHTGEVALMHNGKIIGYFPEGGDAYEHGYKDYGLGNFSIEFVGAEPIDLGFQTLAIL